MRYQVPQRVVARGAGTNPHGIMQLQGWSSRTSPRPLRKPWRGGLESGRLIKVVVLDGSGMFRNQLVRIDPNKRVTFFGIRDASTGSLITGTTSHLNSLIVVCSFYSTHVFFGLEIDFCGSSCFFDGGPEMNEISWRPGTLHKDGNPVKQTVDDSDTFRFHKQQTWRAPHFDCKLLRIQCKKLFSKISTSGLTRTQT